MKRDRHTEGAPATLDQAAVGSTVRVIEVDRSDPSTADRLADLGFWPNALVRVERRAPLGDPVQYRLQGYRIALRRSQARRVRVEVVS